MSQSAPRILVVTSTFPRWKNDTEPAFVFNLCRELHRRGFVVDVLAPHAADAQRYEVMDGISVYRYRYFVPGLESLAYSGGILANLKKNPLNLLLVPLLLLAQARALYRRLRTGQYRLVHAHWLIPQGIVCAMVKKLMPGSPALICTSHGGDLYALDAAFFNAIKRWTIRHSDRLCVVSHAMKARAVGLGVSPDSIDVMPMGVDLVHTFKPVSGVERHANRVIFAGRLVEKKGVACLLEAMAMLVTTVQDMELLIVGDGPLRKTLGQSVIDHGLQGHVRFQGSVPQEQLPALYSSAAIAVIPSIIDHRGDQEGLGLVTIEAMGCGCAVVASALEAIRDVVDETTGLLASPADPADLAAKLGRLLADADLRRRLALQGRQQVLQRFDWQKAGRRYQKLINTYL